MEGLMLCHTKKYIQAVDEMCSLLMKEHNIDSIKDLQRLRSIKPQGQFKDSNDKLYSYTFHGRGCRVQTEDSELDWDIAYDKNGIEPWFVANYLRQCPDYKGDYTSGTRIREEYDKAVAEGLMVKEHGLYYFV